jgi:ABC-type phosphate transport system permease subunit
MQGYIGSIGTTKASRILVAFIIVIVFVSCFSISQILTHSLDRGSQFLAGLASIVIGYFFLAFLLSIFSKLRKKPQKIPEEDQKWV